MEESSAVHSDEVVADDEVAVEVDAGDDDDDEEVESLATPVGVVDDEEVSQEPGSDDDEISVKSVNTATHEEAKVIPEKRKAIVDASPSSKKVRVPSVAGLTIPFRTVKKAMKLDPDTPIVQNEAAIMTTVAVELFVKELSKRSYSLAKSRGRTTVRYEDVAEARASEKAYSFLEPLLP